MLTWQTAIFNLFVALKKQMVPLSQQNFVNSFVNFKRVLLNLLLDQVGDCDWSKK